MWNVRCSNPTGTSAVLSWKRVLPGFRVRTMSGFWTANWEESITRAKFREHPTSTRLRSSPIRSTNDLIRLKTSV